ncbi:uncharacterized protein LOC129913548 [Episyrphus balteatus]|uniref:uncharacterized protein LOC129913548 n=1 Tax=Episyrphus balteatus TaxID=286459 RepID=UPI002486714F|nr:uncharacterized protein LOC129913548 [Episyrphus balteatus]
MPPKVTPEPVDEEYNCRSCREPDSAEDMVQCDQCNEWNHFSCAGVNVSIEEKSYLCQICQGKSKCSVASVSGAGFATAISGVSTKANSQSSQTPATTTATLVQSAVTLPATNAAEFAALVGSSAVFTTPTTTISSQSSAAFPAYSAAEDAAMRGRLANETTTLNAAFYESLSAIHNPAASAQSSVKVSAHSAAEVAAMCGNLFPSNPSAYYSQPYPFATTSTQNVFGLPTLPPYADTFLSNAHSRMTLAHRVPLTSLLSNGHFSATKKTSTQGLVLAEDDRTSKAPFQPPRPNSSSSQSSKCSSTKRLQIELQKIEEERQLRESRDKEELKLRKERDAEYITKKYQIMNQVFSSSDDDDEAPHGSETMKNKSAKAKVNVSKWIDGTTQKDYLHSTTNVNPSPLDLMPITSQHQHISNTCSGAEGKSSFITNQHQSSPAAVIPGSTQFHSAGEEVLLPKPDHQHNTAAVNFLMPTSQRVQNNQQGVQNNQTHQHSQEQNPEHQPSSQYLPSFNNMQQYTPSNNFLTKNNLAARHLIRDLPAFDGNPSEWPLFIASFNRSTELGGFSDEENLIRLHKALKGGALEAVRSLIIQPNCVGRVIETLRMLYGRPELIINTLIRKITSTPSPKAEKLETIVTFAIAVQNLCATIEACGIVDHLNYPMLMQELVDKLPPALRLNWAIHKQSLPLCTLVHFSSWMYTMAEAANGVLVTAPSTYAEEKKRTKWKDKGIVNAHYSQTNPENKCYVCGGSCSSVAECKKFVQSSRTARWEEVRRHRLCCKCLKKHLNQRCKTEALCGKNNCTLKHHQLLHNDQKQPTDGTVGIHSESTSYNTDSVLFRVVPVFLYGNGTKIKVFAFLDDGSSVTLMDEDLAKQLNVKGESRPLCLKWTGNTSRFERKSKLINLQISSTTANAKKFPLANVHTVEKLCLPAQTLNSDELRKKFEHLRGLDIDPYNKAVPLLLIGLDNTQLGFPIKSKERGPNEPVATKTRLGWVIHGKCVEEANRSDKTHSFHVCECNDPELRRLVKNFICDDNFGTHELKKLMMSDDDARALNLLNTRTVRKNGRFETTLLWKIDEFQLPDSYPMARKRLVCLQKRMQRDPVLAEKLNSKIDEYVRKGYARRITHQEIVENKDRSWYLPVFPVENPNKPGKIRIVWDAAAAVRGTSLNSLLLKGPDQLTPLTSVIYKFRQHKIAICGDIMEMYHQVGIREEDQHYQRFLWGYGEEGQPDTYIMKVMTFGATCSPCTAHFVKNTNADNFAAEFPRAACSIKENHYVDDLMDSVPTEEEAITLAQEIRHIHKQGGFHIRNWVSNSSAVLRALQSEPTEQKSMNADVELGTEKVLGMWWCTSLDCLTFKLTTNPNQREILFGSKRPTKREVLRVMMTIFDPLGLISCFLMYIKILLQEIWRSKIEWDDEIKNDEYKKWLKWVHHLSKVEKVKIPRCYVTSTLGSDVQLHVFVDASENGFAAVAYIRSSNNGLVETSLIGAKTRVAPLKALSIPRLELQAALLGARFAKCITESHGISFGKQYFWSDSKTVLCWLRSDHRRYRQYVAFRVSEILELTDIEEWKWIPTNMNVADEATKWQKPPEFKDTSRWFNGPAFLKSSADQWPQEVVVGSTIEDLKTNFVAIHTFGRDTIFRFNEIPTWWKLLRTIEDLKTNFVAIHTFGRDTIFRFNEIPTWWKLLRSTAYALRFVHNTSTKRNKTIKVSGLLSREELQNAQNELLREAQICEYAEEVADLTMNRCVEKSSPLFNLCPFLDENRLIRTNSRIRLEEKLSLDFRLPIILPRFHRITTLIIEDVHHRYNHQNDETVVNILRENFYISQVRSALRAIKKDCSQCKINRASPRPPIMAPLPQARLASFCRKFSYVGVDYFGPFLVTVGRRTEKRWGVLLTCLTIRAVHIEVAHTLTTDSCILCIRNFIARRGTPIEFHSDNGTNFHGAERELREAASCIQSDRLAETFTTTSTQWKFIPPASPHMGGSWERLVRSIKNALYAIAPTRNPNDELLRSMLIEAENIINSRPLTYIPIDPANPEALTPNHFLLGSASGSKPLVEFNDDVTVLRKNWLTSQQFADRFWKRWVAEYLPTLTRRTKWFTPAKPLEVGDIVLVVDPTSPRNSWAKGRIIKVKLSKDDQVRSAFIQTQSGIYERPAVKLALLDIKAPNESPGETTKGEC